MKRPGGDKDKLADKEKAIELEEVTVGGKIFQLKHENVPIEKCELDPSNPRIKYRLSHASGKTAEQELLDWRDIILLCKDIEKTGGLRERIIVQWNLTRKKYKVIEGNCRLASVRSLHAKYTDDPRWQTIPCKLLPSDLDERAISIMLMDWYVVGKIQWKPHEKGAQVAKMNMVLRMPMDEIVLYMRTSKSTVERLVHAHKAVTERFLTIDNGAYEQQGERCWSLFEQMYRYKELRTMAKADPEFLDDFCRWVGDGRIPLGADVRQLAQILGDSQAAKKFKEGNVKTAFAESKRLAAQQDPSINSDFFKLLAKVRLALTDAAQVKEVLKIRTEKAARKQLLDTYDALMGFMQLADVDPEH